MPTLCTRCGSDKIIPYAIIQDQGEHSSGQLRAYVCADPNALIFKGTVYGRVLARICGSCGHTELITQNAAALYAAYKNGARNAGDRVGVVKRAALRRRRRALLAKKKAVSVGKETPRNEA